MNLGPRRTRLVVGVSSLVWLAGIVLGLQALWLHASTPGKSADASSVWPQGGPKRNHSAKYTMMAFIHPQCPCSRASITELKEAVARAQASVDVNLYFYLPFSAKSDWARTDSWAMASEIPNAHLSVDPGGAIAKQFGAITSGQILLYDGERLVFSGGVTGMRGHQGDNSGRQALIAWFRNDVQHQRTHAPVFGCSLLGAQ